jgi:hypothetical protein
MDLLHFCGIDNLPKRVSQEKWTSACLKFIGAEHYVLGTQSAEVSLRTVSGGFGIKFKKPIGFKSESLLGKSIGVGKLYDVLVVFPDSTMPDLSLASMCPERYPHVLRRGQVVRIDG